MISIHISSTYFTTSKFLEKSDFCCDSEVTEFTRIKNELVLIKNQTVQFMRIQTIHFCNNIHKNVQVVL